MTDRVEDYAYGVGGIVGYAKMQTSENAAKLLNCTNHADVSGNLMVGGIVGTIDSQLIYQGSYTDDDLAKIANIKEADNDGLILCTAEVNDSTIQGKYFGGIAGYAEQSLIYDAASASGRAAQFSFDESKKTEYLKGKYVGGIVGYGNSTLVNNCSTEKDGYVLGSDYVGGSPEHWAEIFRRRSVQTAWWQSRQTAVMSSDRRMSAELSDRTNRM